MKKIKVFDKVFFVHNFSILTGVIDKIFIGSNMEDTCSIINITDTAFKNTDAKSEKVTVLSNVFTSFKEVRKVLRTKVLEDINLIKAIKPKIFERTTDNMNIRNHVVFMKKDKENFVPKIGYISSIDAEHTNKYGILNCNLTIKVYSEDSLAYNLMVTEKAENVPVAPISLVGFLEPSILVFCSLKDWTAKIKLLENLDIFND